MIPALGETMPAIIFAKVLLPAPFSPTIELMVPLAKSHEISLSTVVEP
jgi:hypothetical protein